MSNPPGSYWASRNPPVMPKFVVVIPMKGRGHFMWGNSTTGLTLCGRYAKDLDMDIHADSARVTCQSCRAQAESHGP